MNDLNSVMVIGRLTRDAERKYTSAGLAVCKFSIANGYSKKVGDKWEEQVNFFDVTLFGKSGESLAQYLVKGKQVAVCGELRQERWEKDGDKRSKVEIIAQNVQLLGGKDSHGDKASDAPTARYDRPVGNQANGGAVENVEAAFVDDVPF